MAEHRGLTFGRRPSFVGECIAVHHHIQDSKEIFEIITVMHHARGCIRSLGGYFDRKLSLLMCL